MLALEDLIERLFLGTPKELRKLFQALSNDQRSALFKAISPLLKTLRDVCIFFPDDYRKSITVKQLYRQVKPDPQAFVEQWPKLKKQSSTLLSTGDPAENFFTRIQMTQVALAPKSQVPTGLKTGRYHWIGWGDNVYIPAVGRVLLDRPEEWTQTLMIQFFENYDKWVGNDCGGSARLYREVCQTKPDWRETLAPFAGKVMALDGFWQRDAALEKTDPDMIVAGLDYELPRDHWPVPILDKQVSNTILKIANSGRISRQALLKLILEKLLSPRRPMEVKAWLEFYQKLAPTAEESVIQHESFIDLINASASPVAQFAIKLAGERMPAGSVSAAELAGPLGYALSHEVQAVSNKALILLKKIVKAEPATQASVLAAAVQALSTPHDAFRGKLINWLRGFTSEQFDAETLADLAALAENLKPSERTTLENLLPEIEAANVAAVASETVDAATVLANAARQWLDDKPSTFQPTLQKQRFHYLQQYLAGTKAPVLEPVPAASNTLDTHTPFALLETAEELATRLQQALRNHWSSTQQLEQILDGILRFHEQGQRDDIRDPLLQRATAQQEEQYYAASQILIPTLIANWCGAEPPQPSTPAGFYIDITTNYPAFMSRSWALPKLIEQDQRQLLATPTHAVGWLAPIEFAKRYQEFPRQLLDSEELLAALLRLSPEPDAREQAWAVLEPNIDLARRFDQAVALALAAEPIAATAARQLAARLREQPPNEPLYATDLWYQSPKLARRQWQQFDAAPNRLSRLFHAALRARLGLADAHPWLQQHRIELPDHKTYRVEQVDAATELDPDIQGFKFWLPDELGDFDAAELLPMLKEQFGRLRKQEPRLDSLFADLRLNPQPITEEFITQHRASEYLQMGAGTPYLWLIPYLCACSNYMLEFGHHADGPVFNFPPLAQRLFEVGNLRFGEPNLYSDSPQQLMSLGALPHVDIKHGITAVVSLLGGKKARDRERGIDLLLVWLGDGRLTPQQLAAALTQLIRSTSQGFTYLDKSLASLAVDSAAGHIVQQALELVLVDGFVSLSPRNQSLLLGRLAEVLEDNRSAVYEPLAQAALEQMSTSKKKNAASAKAKEIVGRSRMTGTLPPLVACVAYLTGIE